MQRAITQIITNLKNYIQDYLWNIIFFSTINVKLLVDTLKQLFLTTNIMFRNKIFMEHKKVIYKL